MSIKSLNTKQLEYFFEQLWKQTLNPIWVCKVVPDDFEMVSANEAAFRVDPNQKPGVLVSEVIRMGGHDNEILAGYYTCLETGDVVEFEQRPWVNGKEYLFRTLLVPIKNTQGRVTHIWGTAHNLTDFLDPQKELLAINEILEQRVKERTEQLNDALKKLEILSTTDELTGLANRRFLDENLTRAVLRVHRTKEPLAVLFIDIDDFKLFNDEFGHSIGDYCLKQVAATLLSLDRREDDVVARYGGEEFMILLPNCSSSDAMRIAEQVRHAVERLELNPDNTTNKPSHVTISVGVAVSGTLRFTSDELLKEADDALYAAKAAGRNQCILREL
ncbi:GGDEF domain-containing protein [Aliidiomarina sanyensis]|uniref:GGDEF domain-containing protein n=1 Tax=Aliidiomarina sanyensis TaxID=1249555 RepID=UPI0013009E19|nr:GGDEF domain-containing protein [Aliidiomarina sanyensis]